MMMYDDGVAVEKQSTFVMVLYSGMKRHRKAATFLTTVNH